MMYQRSFTVAVSLVAVVGWPMPSPLTPAATSNSYAACIDKSGGVTSAMEDCIAEELELQDRRLNTSYGASFFSSGFGELEDDGQRGLVRETSLGGTTNE